MEHDNHQVDTAKSVEDRKGVWVAYDEEAHEGSRDDLLPGAETCVICPEGPERDKDYRNDLLSLVKVRK